MNHPVEHDPKYLHPAFYARVKLVIADMESQGFDPVVWETVRTDERAAYLLTTGASKTGKRSIHCYKDDQGRVGAVDIISKSKMWFRGDPKGAAKFFRALHACYKKHGLCVIDTPTFFDGPHAQCVPATPKAQDAFRALTPEERGAFIQRVCG